jgi:hypothetical protein
VFFEDDKLITANVMYVFGTSAEQKKHPNDMCGSLCNTPLVGIRLYILAHRLSALLLFATELCKCVRVQ